MFRKLLFVVSMLLCIGTIVLWYESFHHAEYIYYTHLSPSDGRLSIETSFGILIRPGVLQFDQLRGGSIHRADVLSDRWVSGRAGGFDWGRVAIMEVPDTRLINSADRGAGNVGWREPENAVLGFGMESAIYPYSRLSTGSICRFCTIPLWAVMLVIGLPAATFLLRVIARIFRGWRAARVGRCPICGYDLRGTPERCPECGTAPNEVPQRT